jgi:hypothetical protein
MTASLASSEFTLQVFAKDDIVPDGTGAQVPTLTPVRFADAERAPSRTMTPSEFAQLPDFGYSLFDWATGFETCPLDSALPAAAPLDACHDFSTHMGAVNSNHFLPQAQAFYILYHRLALDRAAACKKMKDLIVARGGQVATFDDFVRACEQEAFVLEAIGHHYLQDAWSTGHMWERWGSPDLIDFTDLQQSLLIAMTSGLIHGARGVLQDVLGFAGFDVNDPLCAPGPLVRFVPGPISTPVVGLGDLFLGQLLDQAGAAFPAQYFQLFSCAATSLRQVQRAMGDQPGDLNPSLIEVADPTGSACFAQRATNAAMVDGIGLDFITPGGVPVRVELDSLAATQLVASASAAVGGSPQNVNPILQASYAFDMARIVTHARLRGLAEPDATDLASGGLGPLLGIDSNGAFVQQPLAPYVDPPLPWPDSPTAANDATNRALALARTFHAGHAIDWCNRFRDGATDGSDVDLLRAHVHVVQAAGTGGDELAAACLACETFAERHLRVGTDAGNYDTSREPLCRFLADDPTSTQYVFQPGTPSDDVRALAASYCSCATSTTTTTPSTSTTTTTLPAPTGTITFDLNLPAGSAPQFIGSGTFAVSIANNGGGHFGTSASWGGGTLFVQTPEATCGTNPTTYGLGEVTGTLFTEPTSVTGEFVIKVPLTTPAGACPFDSSGFLPLIFDGELLTPNLIRFFQVCVGTPNCYDTRFIDASAVSVEGVVQIGP